MRPISIAIIFFLVLEILNVMILYFKPSSRKGNGLGFFHAYKKAEEIPEVADLVKYLVDWVAGIKLIFIALLIVILVFADDKTQNLSVVVLILSILSFFWRLYPNIKNMDKKGEITPKGYSKTLAITIFVFIVVFSLALLFTFLS